MPVSSHDVTDEQWEGLAQVVPLRGRDAWPSAVGHRAMPEARTEAARRRFVVLRVNVFADAREVAETLMSGIPVLLDLTGAEPDVAKRVLDFSTRASSSASPAECTALRPQRVPADAGGHGGHGSDGGRGGAGRVRSHAPRAAHGRVRVRRGRAVRS
ncbi:Cell division protein SepF [Streptomyces griseoloalbus]